MCQILGKSLVVESLVAVARIRQIVISRGLRFHEAGGAEKLGRPSSAGHSSRALSHLLEDHAYIREEFETTIRIASTNGLLSQRE